MKNFQDKKAQKAVEQDPNKKDPWEKVVKKGNQEFTDKNVQKAMKLKKETHESTVYGAPEAANEKQQAKKEKALKTVKQDLVQVPKSESKLAIDESVFEKEFVDADDDGDDNTDDDKKPPSKEKLQT